MIADYLSKAPQLKPFIEDFPTLESLATKIEHHSFPVEKRMVLAAELEKQYVGMDEKIAVQKAIQSLKDPKTFTVTTGHQLCLFTGPMYFLFKIISTIRLAEDLHKKYPEFDFVPIYWMASEDHDFQEINHAWINGKKLEWPQNVGGAVGRMPLNGLEPIFLEFESMLPDNPSKQKWIASIRKSLNGGNLAQATQILVDELFGDRGLVVLNPDSTELKQLFMPIMRQELLEKQGDKRVAETTDQLQELGYRTLVHARSINLFYLGNQFRGRIEFKDNSWYVVDHPGRWTEAELLDELKEHPENFSPNVVMRPLYQETILPNLAYIGGPGEISYWLQMKSNFDYYGISFPLLILRDSALILNSRQKSKFAKTGLSAREIFAPHKEQLERILPVSDTSIESEKKALSGVFEQLRNKAKTLDPTLEAFVNAEEQRQLQGIEGVGKKMIRSLKQREEVKIQQLEKIMEELMPGGKLNERRDNIFPLLCEFDNDLLNALYESFNPLAGEIKVNLPE